MYNCRDKSNSSMRLYMSILTNNHFYNLKNQVKTFDAIGRLLHTGSKT